MAIVINLAREFSSNPGGRFRVMGPASGEEFRDRLLRELRRDPGSVVEIVLDGAEGYGSSFLKEAFGGLIRKRLVTLEEARRRVKIVARTPSFHTYAQEARQYMEEAGAQLK